MPKRIDRVRFVYCDNASTLLQPGLYSVFV